MIYRFTVLSAGSCDSAVPADFVGRLQRYSQMMPEGEIYRRWSHAVATVMRENNRERANSLAAEGVKLNLTASAYQRPEAAAR